MSKINSNEINNYLPEDFFLLRKPLLPIKELEYKVFQVDNNIDLDKYIELIGKSSKIMEAVLVSSESLYNSIINYNPNKDLKKKKDIFFSLLKYVIRMGSRPTPYGLFSGVSSGTFIDDSTNSHHVSSQPCKRARVDMVWLYKLIERLEKDHGILEYQILSLNSTFYTHGDRVYLSYISNYGQARMKKNDKDEFSSIKKTKVVDYIFEILKEPKTYLDLINNLCSLYPDVERQYVEDTIDNLIQSEYILTNLRPSFSNSCKITELLEKLNTNSDHKIYFSLTSLSEMIEEYNTTRVGEGESKYLEIIKMMESICTSESYLQVDMKSEVDSFYLGKKSWDSIRQLANFISQIASPMPRFEHLESYMHDFLNIYGESKVIKLTDLLDDDLGLGAPNTYRNPLSKRQNNIRDNTHHNKIIQDIIYNKIQEANLLRKTEVEFEINDFHEVVSKLNPDELPNSMEFYFNIGYCNKTDEYKLYFGEHLGISDAGSSFGRFTDLQSDISDNYLKLLNSKKIFLNDNSIYVQLNELPNNGRIGNVTLIDSSYKHEISIGTSVSKGKEKISLDEIYVGVHRENGNSSFFFFSSKLKKQLIFKSNNMLNPKNCSNYYRFLTEVSSMKEKCIISNFYYNFYMSNRHLNYVPRFKFKSIVIKPASWKLNGNTFEAQGTIKLDSQFVTKLAKWENEYFVPRHLYIINGDNRLLVDLRNELCLQLLINELNKSPKRELFLTEIEGEIDQRTLFNNEFYFSEIVVPLIKQNTSNSSIPYMNEMQCSQIAMKILSQDNDDFKSIFFPGEEWLTMKLYGNSKRLNDFLTKKLYFFVINLQKYNYISQFFFVRYSDPQEHIRLRVRISNNQSELLKKINEWFIELLNEGFLTNVVFDTYMRESERYGGTDLIAEVESLFYYDSLFACELLQKEEDTLKIIDYCALSIIIFLKAIGVDYDSQFSMIDCLIEKSVGRNHYRIQRKALLKIVDSDNFEILKETNMGLVTYNYSNQMNEVVTNFTCKIESNSDRLTNSKQSIYLSIIHMHCNRILGNKDQEVLTLGIVRHILRDVLRKNR